MSRELEAFRRSRKRKFAKKKKKKRIEKKEILEVKDILTFFKFHIHGLLLTSNDPNILADNGPYYKFMVPLSSNFV